MNEFDVAVIGAGPAGASAAIYAARAGLKTALIGFKEGSGLAKAKLVENYYGFPQGVGGMELLEKGVQQAKKFGAVFLEEEVTALRKTGEGFEVQAASGKIGCKSIVIATGASRKKSGIIGEKEFLGKGVSYCAKCDGYFFKEKSVVVVGNKNYAASEALELTLFTSKVTLFTQGKEAEFSEEMKKKLLEKKVVVRNDKIVEVRGRKFVEEIVLENKGVEKADGVFIALDVASSTDLAAQLGVEVEGQFVSADKEGKTNVQGVFAAGDCTGGKMQASIAAGEGTNAALNAIAFIRKTGLGNCFERV